MATKRPPPTTADKPAQRMRFEVVVFILVLLIWAFAEPEVGVERRSSPGAPSVRWLDHTVVRDVLDSPSPHLVIEFGHLVIRARRWASSRVLRDRLALLL